MARSYFKYFRKEGFDAIVVDEIHRLKNPASAQSRRVALLSKDIIYRYGLTGTQIQDTVIDLFGQYRTVDPSILGDKWSEFKQRFLYPTGYMGKKSGITKRNKKKVLELIAPITYQVTKKEAFPNRKVLEPVYLFAELKGTQKKLYEQLESDFIATYDEFEITAPRTITQMLRLQQISGGHCPSDEGDMLTFECGKAQALQEFLTDFQGKVVIFARFIHELKLIEQVCKKLGMSCEIYTPKRPDLEDRFQEKDNPRVFISQIQRGGIALTLTRASTAIFFSKTFSSLDYVQAIGRIDRGGQTEPVTPIFISTKDTIDEDIDDAIGKKLSEAAFVSFFLERLKKRLTNR